MCTKCLNPESESMAEKMRNSASGIVNHKIECPNPKKMKSAKDVLRPTVLAVRVYESSVQYHCCND